MRFKVGSFPYAFLLLLPILASGCGLQQTLEDIAIKEALATPVSGLKVLEPVSGGTVKLTWNPHPSNKVVRYTLYRSFTPSPTPASAPSLGILRIRWLASSRPFQPLAIPQKIADIAVPGNTYTDQVSQAGTYSYTIRAVVTTGEETVPSVPLAVCVDQNLNECGSSPPGGSSGGSTSGGSTSGGSTSGGSTSGGSTSGGSTSGGSTSGGGDTTPPDTTIQSGPSNPTSSTSVSFTFTCSEAGCTFECRLDGSAWTVCTSPQNYSGLPDGAHTFEVRARDAAGNLDPTPAVWNFTVNTGGGSNLLSVRFLDASGSPTDPIFLAAQDGSSSWFPPQRTSVGLYEFPIFSPDGYYGIAVVCESSQNLEIILSSLAEVTHFTYTYCGGTPPFTPTVSLQGTITGDTSDPMIYAAIFARSENCWFCFPSYSLYPPMNTPFDLFAFGVSSSGASRFYLERGLSLSSPATRDIDFTLSDPRYTDGVTHPLSITSGVPGDTVQFSTIALWTQNQTSGSLPVLDPSYFPVPETFYASPDPLLLPGDKLSLIAGLTIDPNEWRLYFEGLAGPQGIARTLNLPPTPFPGPFTNPIRSGYLRFTVGIPPYPSSSAGNPLFYQLWITSSSTPSQTLTLTLSPSRVGTVSIPDFSGTPGWNNIYGLDPNATTLYWEMGIVSSTLSVQTLLDLMASSEGEFVLQPIFGTHRLMNSQRSGFSNLP